MLVEPQEATQEMLKDVHTEEYLLSVNESGTRLAEITEISAIALLPNSIVQHRLNRPMRVHVAGTILAVGMALQWGWSINLGGGMHHASYDRGGGWCVYDDWTLALRKLRRETGGAIRKAMLIDLDVHQGNGHARDKLHFKDEDLYILDLYNADLWPWDTAAKAATNCDLPMRTGTGDEEYLAMLDKGLHTAFSEFTPDIVLYNAGTDILIGDPLGRCRVSPDAVAKRDEMVFQAAHDAGVPICMALSGGYAKDSAGVISKCIEHVVQKFGLIQPSSKV
ncbi:g8094 [Coccomyxa elongata]